MREGLTRRMVIASGLLALLIAAAFAVLFFAISSMRDSQLHARQSRVELGAADELEKLVVDLETGARGFVITRKERFLEPWKAARAAFPAQARALTRLTDDPGQAARARQIVRAGTSYIREYSVPLVSAARRDEASTRSVAITAEGKRRVDALRAMFDRFTAIERTILNDRQAETDADAQRAIVAATGGLAGSVLLIVLFTGYLTRAIVRPVSRAAAMAGRLAGGDLAARMPETAPDEIGTLEKAFNTMAGSLEESRGELQRLADEQAALRRVATLVARGVSPPAFFNAVAGEMGRILDAEHTAVNRYEADGSMTVVGSWSSHESDVLLPVGSHWSLEGDNVSEMVFRTGRPARMTSYEGAAGQISDWARDAGLTSSIGSPVVVEGRLWGMLDAFSTGPEPPPDRTEERMLEFTELVATAIANTESRTELTASRARVVAAADETRRRIERDLHDGAQQRLVSLALELRGAEAGVPAGLDKLRAQLSQTTRGLSEVLEDLQEISRGIHPAILSKGGVESALKVLARRSAVPVELDVRASTRLPEHVEVALYYVVSETLTNTAKHADASVVHVDVEARDGIVQVSIRDDGVGGADPGRGSGLVGLRDRVEALGGTIQIASPVGGGTTLLVTLPVDVG